MEIKAFVLLESSEISQIECQSLSNIPEEMHGQRVVAAGVAKGTIELVRDFMQLQSRQNCFDDLACFKEEAELKRILNRELFLYFLDLEVKQAQRYQNFFCIMILNLTQFCENDYGQSLQTCYQKLTHLLTEELRESDILGSLGENKLAALLPYADPTAGSHAKSRFERSLKYYDFNHEGYKVKIDQVCFPMDGTNTADIVKRVMGAEAS
jgi:PleD family two-component response regulator